MRVEGFRAAGIHAGIKKSAPDLALIVADAPAAVAGVFTRSTVPGAPVLLSRERVRSGRTRGVVVNSGCSNVAMGKRGERDAFAMTAAAARAVGCAPEHFLVASTGVIGEPLPMPIVRRGIVRAADALHPDGWADAAEAIRTTDTFAKLATRRVSVGGRKITITGIAKGSGMIEPDMATMLSFLATDADCTPGFLRSVLARVANETYNRLTIDGEGSTSDSVVLMASGRSGGARLSGPRSPGAGAFESAVHTVAETLVRDLARDGEGATKLITVDVTGAASGAEAARAAKRIANSALVKTAIFGGDPNWGRIVQTLGAGHTRLRLDRLVVKLGGVAVFRNGASAGPAARKRAEAKLAANEVDIHVELGTGRGRARVWTCDYSYDYIRINAEYTT